MAVPAILSDLVLRDENPNSKTVWSKYRKASELYDIIIDIQNLIQLQTEGWEIKLGQHIDNIAPTEIKSPGLPEGVPVAVLGAYNRGKTFLLSKLCGVELPHSHLAHTDGISITAGRTNYTNIVFMDTAGIDTPASREDVRAKRATEAIIREVVLHLASFIIIVVNRLRGTDQKYIERILEHCRDDASKKSIIIVHNLSDVTTVQDVQKTIEEEVRGIYEAKEDNRQFREKGHFANTIRYTSKPFGFQMTHFILAKEGSAAAKTWNTQSLDGIMNMLQAPTEHNRSIKIISEMIKFLNTKLPQLLIIKEPLQIDNIQTTMELAQHTKLPRIVLSSRKELGELKQEPCSLEISQNLVYDEQGYFIKHALGFWTPRYNFYEYSDHISVVLELPGFEKGSFTFQKTDNSFSIKGHRSQLLPEENTTMTVSEIPAGDFQLDLRFKSPIDKDTVKSDRKEGLIFLTAKKKDLGAEEQHI